MLACVPIVYAIWCVPFLPTHDGPKHIYAGHVRSHIDDPAYAGEYLPSYPLTSFGFSLLYALFERVVPWQAAYALAWTLAILTLPVGVWQLARAFDPARALLGLFGVAGAIHWSVHMGFANYVPSVGLGLLAIGVGFAADEWSPKRELSVYGIMLLTCAFHPVGAQLAAVSLFVFRVLGARRGRIVRELGAMLVACAPAAAITILSAAALDDMRAQGLVRAEYVPLTPMERLENMSICFLSGPLWRSLPVLLMGLSGLAAGIFAISRWVARDRKTGSPVDRRTVALLVLIAGCLYMTLTSPMHSKVWEHMQPRFIPPTVFAALVLVPIERLSARLRQVGVVLGLFAAVSSNLWVAHENRAFAAQHRAALSGLGQKPEKGRTLLTVVARRDTAVSYQRDRTRAIPYAAPLYNLGQIYAVDRDAVTPYAFAFLPDVHLIRLGESSMGRIPKRDYGDFFRDGADPVVRKSELVRLASFGVGFDDLMFYGAPDEVDLLIELGYRAETRSDGFMIGSLVGCPVSVTVAGATRPGSVTLGWLPSDREAHRFATAAVGEQTFAIERASCGAMWVRWLAADDGIDSLRCRGANDRGMLELDGFRPAIRCELVPP